MLDPSGYEDVFWQPASGRTDRRRRNLGLLGLCLLSGFAFAFAKLRTQGAKDPGEHAPFKRQFQFGAILAAHQAPEQTIAVGATPPASTTSDDHTSDVDSSSLSTFEKEPVQTQGSASAVEQVSQSQPSVLLDALIAAFSKLVVAPLDGPESTITIAHSARSPQTRALREIVDSSLLSPSLQPSSAVEVSSIDILAIPTMESVKTTISQGPESNPITTVGLVSGFAGELTGTDNLQTSDDWQKQKRRDPMAPDGSCLPLLGPLSDLVRLTISIDIGAAGRLLDVILDALPISTDAVASAIPPVAAQVSATFEDIFPLILPAVAAALGHQLEHVEDIGVAQSTEVLRNIVKQGLEIINGIFIMAGNSLTPELRAILDHVVAIVDAAAKRLGQRLCAITQDIQGIPIELLLPCASTTAQQSQSTSPGNASPLNNVDPSTIRVATDTSFSNDLLATTAQTYGSAESGVPAATVSSTSATCPTTVQTPAAGYSSPSASYLSGEQSQATTQLSSGSVLENPPCPTCPSCTESRPEATSAGDAVNGAARPTPNAASGPCPGRGFSCSDCLNGWFCPPQETPAQVVPCGLGWPCFHCKSGYYCAVQDAPPLASSTTASSIQTPSVTSSATPAGDSNRHGDSSPRDWQYLGCFRDAIDRTLAGARPLDYLRGDMSNATCINHCASKGYVFGGTECGTECWCGSTIRDDALRLPESFCDTACQGAEGQRCGGSWAISAFS
ncbi:hypothetical protein HIM_04630 [Hirsutella minnesotensis 3608]|uniref:WSC domain-containing protein n=1 Tax=Hirsutella minnesotensis 3608 TaxID=1043627 RepID=A0A0F8A5Z2_9HYPO|nr:hypothetical protein HIM_04630 [Hirsutella minnesotensis 3608]